MTDKETNPCRETRGARPRYWLLALALLPAVGCGKVNLYSDLPEREANTMMAALLDEGIECEKEDGDEENTWRLLVAVDNFSRSVNVLTEMGYPTDQRQSMSDMFQRTTLVSSPTETRIRYVYALSEELAETISHIDGVVDARVHVVLPNNDPFSEHVRPSSASVYIKHRNDIDMTASRAQIKELVAKSIEGLDVKNVEVFLDEVQRLQLPEQKQGEFSRVLGITLQSGSVNRFWRLFGCLLAVALINLALLLWFTFRHHFPSVFWLSRSDSTSVNSEASATT